MKPMLTRHVIKCPVFGTPHELSPNVLPTYYDVMKYCNLVKFQLKGNEGLREPKFSDVSDVVAIKLEDVWRRASVPVVSHTRILKIMRTYHDEYKKLMKPYKERKNNDKYKTKLQIFERKSRSDLFDIAACKCQEFGACRCDKDRKVPVPEQSFLHDQRTVRLMVIAGVDVSTSKKMRKRLARKTKDATRLDLAMQDKLHTEGNVQQRSEDEGTSTSESESMPSSDHSYDNNEAPTTSISKSHVISTQMRVPLPSLAMTCDRYGVSDRAAAAIGTSVLQDVGVVKKDDKSKVIDRSKLRRERQRKRSEVIRNQKSDVLTGLYFDGRKDKTLRIETIGRKRYRRSVVEEHVSLVQEPGSKYIGHIVPSSSCAANVEKCISDFLLQNNITSEHLVAVGCDGTASNTGNKGGIVALLEARLNRPLQWLVCQLHGNELPLRHLMQHLDGPTSGPHGFKGPIGSALLNCEQIPVVEFMAIETDLPSVTNNDLSTDQKYLLDICRAISSGHCPDDLAQRDPGRLAHSRWVTTANRILRLYVAMLQPSPQLQTLATYVVKVYVPMWFQIKAKPSCTEGAKHLWKTIRLSRYLPDELKTVVDPVIQRNGYFAHPENLLLAMISDDRRHVRELGLRRLMKAKKQKKSGLRKFAIPILNFQANEYFDLIDWQEHLTEPPLLLELSEDEISHHIREAACAMMEFPKFPCHTQAVERCVKLVTEASAAVSGAEARHGFIHVRLESRSQMPCFETKSDYSQE
jgi:hypothetical protein